MFATQGDSSSNMNIKSVGGRVGSYAVSTINIESWVNEPVTQAPQRTRKTRGTKEIVHKIFAECAKVIQDSFWIEKFNIAATGKFPRGFSYHDGQLSYKKGAKNHSIEISGNPYETAYACIEFFHTHGGIFSPIDEQSSLQLQYERSQAVLTQKQLTWADANKKIQECILSYYVITMKSTMGLTDLEVEQLRQTIKLGISNKYFGKHNIRIENNHIHSIDGLLWNNETRIFYINPQLQPSSTRSYTRHKDGPPAIDPSQKDMIPQFTAKWEKYVKSVDDKIAQYYRRQRKININYVGGVKHLQLVSSTGSTPNSYTNDDTTNDNSTNDDSTNDETDITDVTDD